MDRKTINKLNNLNQQFYNKTAAYFDDSRQYYWSGWEQLLPHLTKQFAEQKNLSILDLGCGNGRFGSFLAENLPHKLKYLGIDNSPDLLAAAKKRFLTTANKHSFYTQQKDIVTATLENTLNNETHPESQDLIVMFGLWHHLPSQVLRQNLLMQLSKILKENGLLIFTAWKFYQYERFKEKIVPPQEAGINPEKLESNDFILDWKRGTEAYRYCHYSTDEELEKTINTISELNLVETFRADGKQESANQYLILEKN